MPVPTCANRLAQIGLLGPVRGARWPALTRASAAQCASSSGSRCSLGRQSTTPSSHHPLRDDCAAGAPGECRPPRANRCGSVGRTLRLRNPNRRGSDRHGSNRHRSVRGSEAGRAKRPWECLPSRVTRRASPTGTHHARCPRATPRRDPQAGVHGLRARWPPWLVAPRHGFGATRICAGRDDGGADRRGRRAGRGRGRCRGASA